MPTEAATQPRRWPWLAFALCAAWVLACSSGDSAETPHPGRGVYVPLSWSQARTIDGHELHVGKKQVACRECHAIGETSMGAVSPLRCAGCHEKESRITHAASEASARLKRSSRATAPVSPFSDSAGVQSLEALRKSAAARAPDQAYCAHCHGTLQGLTPRRHRPR